MGSVACQVIHTGPETQEQRECGKDAAGYSADGVAVCRACEDKDTLRIVRGFRANAKAWADLPIKVAVFVNRALVHVRAFEHRGRAEVFHSGLVLCLKLLRPSVQFGAYILPGDKPEKLMSFKEDPREAKKALALLKRLDAESLTFEVQPTDGLQLTKDA